MNLNEPITIPAHVEPPTGEEIEEFDKEVARIRALFVGGTLPKEMRSALNSIDEIADNTPIQACIESIHEIKLTPFKSQAVLVSKLKDAGCSIFSEVEPPGQHPYKDFSCKVGDTWYRTGHANFSAFANLAILGPQEEKPGKIAVFKIISRFKNCTHEQRMNAMKAGGLEPAPCHTVASALVSNQELAAMNGSWLTDLKGSSASSGKHRTDEPDGSFNIWYWPHKDEKEYNPRLILRADTIFHYLAVLP